MLKIPNPKKLNPKQIPSPKSQLSADCFGDWDLDFSLELEIGVSLHERTARVLEIPSPGILLGR
jgi:hypothetical protein